jgi:hypothetical protein
MRRYVRPFRNVEQGLITADLGGGVVKQPIARCGKSRGWLRPEL